MRRFTSLQVRRRQASHQRRTTSYQRRGRTCNNLTRPTFSRFSQISTPHKLFHSSLEKKHKDGSLKRQQVKEFPKPEDNLDKKVKPSRFMWIRNLFRKPEQGLQMIENVQNTHKEFKQVADKLEEDTKDLEIRKWIRNHPVFEKVCKFITTYGYQAVSTTVIMFFEELFHSIKTVRMILQKQEVTMQQRLRAALFFFCVFLLVRMTWKLFHYIVYVMAFSSVVMVVGLSLFF